ncbi:acetyltransferase [Deinococcus lacus]|uniref:Acetyltransferase n=1 Tax=Deinococcus lacus TaxID=392561 RepID=A0ABW1YED9_9DEIO
MTQQGSLHILGAGGHAKVVLALAQAAGYRVAGVYDDSAQGEVLGVPVLGPLSHLEAQPGALAVLAIGRNSVRQALAQRFAALEWVTLVHPAAWVAPTAQLGPGTVVMAGAVIQPDTRVGGHVIVNTRASLDHDGDIGDFAHLAPGCCLAGNVTVGEGAFLGAGSICIPGTRVGEWATVGAGATVIRPVEARVTAVGTPARALPQR